MTTPTYCYATDDEGPYVGEYATREEALADGVAEALDEEKATVYTARNGGVARASQYLSAHAVDNLLDALIDQAGDDGAETADTGWLENVTRDQEAALHARLAELVDSWCDEHGHTPKFWHVEDVQEHVVPAEATP
jgi:hypothetical protein